MNHDYYVQLCCDEFALGTFCVSWCGMPVLDNKKYKYKCIYIYSIYLWWNQCKHHDVDWLGRLKKRWRQEPHETIYKCGFHPSYCSWHSTQPPNLCIEQLKSPRVRPTCHCCWQRYACWWELPFGWAHYHWPWIKPGWWLTYPSEKYESQLGIWFTIYGKVLQTTNQNISLQ